MKKYTLETNDREPKPRSKRLRELGGGTSGSTGATVVNVTGQTATADPNSHTHANKSDLDKLSTDSDGYGYITQQREVVETDDEGNEQTTWQGVTDKVKAGYADRAGIAYDLTDDSPVRSQFLSKIADDVAQGRITFAQGLYAIGAAALEGGLTVGEYVQGAKGAAIDTAGNAEVESITARSFLKVFELIYNRINALEGTTSFADVGTIDSVEDTDDGQVLTMRKRWDNDFTAFQPGDVIYGYVNDLQNENAGTYYKAWAWVKSVDRAANTLTVARYADGLVPAGVNFAMRESMVVTRWGNNIEANAITWANDDYSAVITRRSSGDYYNTRQSSFFISCEDGNLVELMGVNAPIITASNYGTVLGKIPAGLIDDQTAKLINSDQPYLYARGIIVQDLIRVDYNGVVTRTANYRGTWSAETAASETEYYRSTDGVYDTVTWNNCLWQCITSGTTDEPSNATGSWVNMSGGVEVPNLSVWKILPNTDIITLRYDSDGNVAITPASVTCEVLLTDTTDGTKTYTSSADLQLEHGVKLYYSLDGATWHEFVIGNAEPLETEDSEAFEAESSTEEAPQYLILGGDDVSSTEIGDRIYFELRNDTDVLARNVIPIVKDGYEGKDGLLVYPAGNYNANTTYSATDESSPVVVYEGNYYMLLRGKSYLGSTMPEGRQTPADDVATGGSDVRWRLFDKFNAIFADVIMADFAKLGGAVFYGDYMFSQAGTLNGVEVSGVDDSGKAYYSQFTDGVTPGTFIPNLLLNFASGQLVANKATVRGTINALGGTIAGFTINEDEISYGDVSDLTSSDTSPKAAFSPRRLVIQDQDADQTDSYYRVALGKAADPNNSYDFGCLAFLYKNDKSNVYQKAFYPTMRVVSKSNYGTLVSMLSKGALITDVGAIAENGKIVTTDDSVSTIEKLNAWEGSVFSIRNTDQDAGIYLPTIQEVRQILNNSSDPFVWRVKFTVSVSSKRVRIYVGIADGGSVSIYNGTTTTEYFTASPGKFYEAWLICDGYENFWQVREI